MPPTIDRLHYMDSMRAILMMLGVVLHSAQVFNPDQSWLIYSTQTHVLFDKLIEVISSFRMPAFFVVSGYFCALTLRKYKAKKFLRVRLTRIVIPFATTAIILNSLQTWILANTGWLHFDWLVYISNGEYVAHLWFLTNLMIYFAVAALISTSKLKIFGWINNQCVAFFTKFPLFVVLATLPILHFAVFGLNKAGFPLYSDFYGLFDTYLIFYYAPYFVFGAIVASHTPTLDALCKSNIVICIAMVLASHLALSFIDKQAGFVWTLIGLYLLSLAAWFAVAGCFAFFYRYLNRASKKMLFLSDASYTVYLFHHVLVIALGLLLIQLNVHALVGGPLLMLAVFILTLLIHKHVILKVSAMSYLFNGK